MTLFKKSADDLSPLLWSAPMEDISDKVFRKLCRQFGADITVTEFVNSDGLIRKCSKARKKMKLSENDRPAGIQIYGHLPESMTKAAEIALAEEPDFIDINAGCWVKKVVKRGAGAGLLKNLPLLEQMIQNITKLSDVPVTLKTRLGWDQNSINIVETAKRAEQAGAAAIIIHGRTRCQGYKGEADHSYISTVKNTVQIPVIANGDIAGFEKAYEITKKYSPDGLMVGRSAIGNPWIFREIKDGFRKQNKREIPISAKAAVCLSHFLSYIEFIEEPKAIKAFRKFYSGYIKNFPEAASLRKRLVTETSSDEIQNILKSLMKSF